MEKIAVMSRDLDMTNRIQVHSIPEVKDGLTSVTTRLARGLKFRGRKLGYGPLLNAIVALYLRLPEERQEELAGAGLELLEKMLESDEPRDDLVTPGLDATFGSVATGEEPVVQRGVAVGARARRRRDANPKREDKPTKSS